MASPRVSVHLPLYDPKKSTLAYGDRALPKLNRELQSEDLSVRHQALLLLQDVIHRRENLTAALKEGIAQTLQNLLKDADPIVRQRSAIALSIIAQHGLGRKAFLELDMITALSKLFSDAVCEVRVSAYKAVEMCARTKEGAVGVVTAGLVPLCAEKLTQEENHELKALILDTLHWCFQADTTEGLQSNTIPSSSSLLSHPSPTIRGKAARIIYDLTTDYKGKEAGCEKECLEGLVRLFDDEDEFVRAQSIAALMSIAVITKGKYTAIECGALPLLIKLIPDTNSEVRLNAIKALTLLAETPEGKKELQSILPQLRALLVKNNSEDTPHSPTAAELKALHTAERVITWTP